MQWSTMQIFFMIKFLNINLNVRNKRKMVRILRGSSYKITYIVVANNLTLPHRTLGTELKLRHYTRGAYYLLQHGF